MITRRAFALGLLPLPAMAQEYLAVDRAVSDQDFYRIVACAAPPGDTCRKPLVRWPAPDRLSLRAGIAAVSPEFPGYKFDLVDRAIDAAIAEINAAGAHLFIDRAFGGDMDVPFFLTATPSGGTITGTGNAELDGLEIEAGRVVIRSREAQILSAAVALSVDIARREIASVVLEELVQAMGLLTDVAGEAYRSSIFAEDGNSVVRLRGQDAEALRLHYPRP